MISYAKLKNPGNKKPEEVELDEEGNPIENPTFVKRAPVFAEDVMAAKFRKLSRPNKPKQKRDEEEKEEEESRTEGSKARRQTRMVIRELRGK